MFKFCPNAKFANFSCRPIFLDLQYIKIINFFGIYRAMETFQSILATSGETLKTVRMNFLNGFKNKEKLHT